MDTVCSTTRILTRAVVKVSLSPGNSGNNQVQRRSHLRRTYVLAVQYVKRLVVVHETEPLIRTKKGGCTYGVGRIEVQVTKPLRMPKSQSDGTAPNGTVWSSLAVTGHAARGLMQGIDLLGEKKPLPRDNRRSVEEVRVERSAPFVT
ncbi:hypothetical protein B0H13DRAFT_1915202 [Mycena leptocephala]|nr:hypothetical protein B0H13DRAFT_1915202 [Mycena leptocephala]